ncbi:hypothetical protein NP493_2792g00006 [Ridgeia piscesae]|uniref:Uncharacterized protein n=1 Tax=Ridgeia piscesae TaxID=27915 RepID=A0AAD9JC03_RIDPI|nr:hypothetical protein NP493_2792g00006 [Ridgeia piscesae]
MARGVWTFVALVFGGAVTLQYGCAGPVPDECARHAQGPGIVWMQYKPNCHKYVMCEPVGSGKYRKHVMPCGDLFWDQNAKTCTRTKTGNCVVGSPVGYTGPPPVHGPCPYVRDAHTPQYFYSRADSSQVQHCARGLEFSEEVCTCLPVSQVEPSCSDDLLLHFDFENGFNDVTCHHAAADQYGDGAVQIVSDPHRGGNVALFNGHGYLEVAFMTSWFADNHVTAFTVSLFFKPANVDSYSVLVHNGNSHEYPSFGLASIGEITQAALITADDNRGLYGPVVSG